MISVIVYGRNDSHGYNLHKRAAIFFNTLGDLLTGEGDEIVFADCNTQEGLPTFPEVLQDVLTPRAREKIRIIRIPAPLFREKFPETKLPAIEAFSRNVALRRARPENGWVLSTNTDMVFAPRRSGDSLTDLVSRLKPHHYLLPRYNVPEWLWEGLERQDVGACLKAVRGWSSRLHLSEVCTHRDDIAFDSPGDFQLAPRSVYFDLNGCDERMRSSWHVDANLCRRFFLKLGKPRSLEADLEGFHLNHNLQANLLHTHDVEKNDFKKFYVECNRAEVSEQAETWGLAGVELDEIRLPSRRYVAFQSALERALPQPSQRPSASDCTMETYNGNFFYDPEHVIPYLGNFLAALEPGTRVAYWGLNVPLLTALHGFLDSLGRSANLLISRELCRLKPEMGTLGEAVPFDILEKRADLFIADFHLGGLASPPPRSGLRDILSDKRLQTFCQTVLMGVQELAGQERIRLEQGRDPRRFIFVGHQNTEYEGFLQGLFRIILGPFNDHVHYGVVQARTLGDAKPAKPESGVEPGNAMAPEPSHPGKAEWTGVSDPAKPGFNVIGYVTSSTGLGVAARNTARLLRNLGYPVALLDVDGGLDRSGKENELAELMADPSQPLPHPINVFHMNPFEQGILLRQNHPAIRMAGRMNICVPFWELARIPGNWVPVLESMDLVLAPTHFIQNAMAASLNRAGVRYYPQSIEPLSGVRGDRGRWGIPDGALVFGFSFDFTSVFERKNPLAVIQAFLKVFAVRKDVVLVIKMNHSKALPAYEQIAAKLEMMRREHPNLVFVNASLPYREVLELMSCWDVYVSLHRAEGLGLGLMECMSMGKAVMATAWSGNMDFMDDCNSVLVGHRLVGVDPTSSYNFCLNGETGHVWAEADVEEAALWMKRLAEDPELRRRLGSRARLDMEARHKTVREGKVFRQVERFYEQWKYRRSASKPATVLGKGGMRVLFQNRPSADMAPGGDTVVMNRYREYLEKRGVSVDVIHDDSADPSQYDLVHLFNLVLPRTIEPFARRAAQAGTPYFVEAFQENQEFYLGRSLAMYRLLLAYMQKGQERALLPRLMELMKMAGPLATDTSAFAANNARAVIVSSGEEREYLLSLHPEAKTVVCMHGAEVDPLDVGPEAFEKEFGVKDFTLCVGRLEPRKNQLALLAALEDEDMPVVFADGGVCYSPDYANVCRQFRRKGRTVYTGRLSKELLVSAYRAARTHVLPSWYELPGLVTLEAALYGCNVAASPHGGIREYMGETCRYFEPGDLAQIRSAVLRSWSEPKTGAAAQAAGRFTWEKAGEQIYRMYQDALRGQGESMRGAPVLAASP